LTDLLGLAPVGGWPPEGPGDEGENLPDCSSLGGLLSPQQLSSWGVSLTTSLDKIIVKDLTGEILATIPKTMGNILSTSVGLLDAALAKGVMIVLIERNLKDYYGASNPLRYMELHSMVSQENYIGAVVGIVSDGNEFRNIGDLL
jgi:hypothetical protein